MADDMTQALVLQPGDRVLVAFSRALHREDGARLKEQLRERFPGVEFTLVDSVAGLVVQRPDPESAA